MMARVVSSTASFPTRAVRYVVPFPDAGPPDAIARLVAAELARKWGQPVTVDNRPGATGNLGADFVASAPPDGHTLLQGNSATHGSNPALFANLPFDPQKAFAPVAALIEGPLYLAVGLDQQIDSVEALLARARAAPGTLRFATAGPGSPHHLAGELLKAKAGVALTAVHYEGAARALRAVLECEAELFFGSDLFQHPSAAQLRLLGVSTRWRWPLAAHVPTMVECGVPDFEFHGWFGVFAPARTPGLVVDRINRDINEVLGGSAVSAGIRAMGYRALGGPPADLQARVAREIPYWAEVVRQNGLALV